MFPQANLLAWYGKNTKPITTKAHIHQSQETYYSTKYTQKLMPGLVAFYDIRPGKRSGSEVTTLWRYTNMFIIISTEKISKEKVEKEG